MGGDKPSIPCPAPERRWGRKRLGMASDTPHAGQDDRVPLWRAAGVRTGNARERVALSLQPWTLCQLIAATLPGNIRRGEPALQAVTQTGVLQAADGHTLLNTQVAQLTQPMATCSSNNGSLSWTQAIQDRPDEVQAVLAAHWQPTTARWGQGLVPRGAPRRPPRPGFTRGTSSHMPASSASARSAPTAAA
jgi:hypothetical protein